MLRHDGFCDKIFSKRESDKVARGQKGRTKRTDKKDGQKGRTKRTDKKDGQKGRTKRTDKNRPTGRKKPVTPCQHADVFITVQKIITFLVTSVFQNTYCRERQASQLASSRQETPDLSLLTWQVIR
jgi:hypothetical protein